MRAPCCSMIGCPDPQAWQVPRSAEQRPLMLCEAHATRWLMGERDYFAELDAMAGRKHRPRPGTLRALLDRYGPRLPRQYGRAL